MMNKLPYYLQLIRPINLFIIFITQLLFVLKGSDHTISNIIFPDFSLIALSVMLTAAAGYVVNDVFDVEIDKINKPIKQVVPSPISFKAARIFYFSLVGLSIIMAFFVGLMFGYLVVVVNLLLYYYSQDLKKSILFGNALVAFLSGMVVFTTYYAYYPTAENYHAMYSLMAFAITMARELVKDIQDMEGDAAHCGRTLPIVYGIRPSRWLSMLFIVMAAAILTWVAVAAQSTPYWFYLGALFAWMAYCIKQLWQAEKSREYGRVSGYLKLAMFAGIVSVLFV